MKTLLIITAYIAPYVFIPVVFRFAGGVLGNLSGMVNNRAKGVFDRQRKFRGARRADDWSRFKRGERGVMGARTVGLGLGTYSAMDRKHRSINPLTRGGLITARGGSEGRQEAATNRAQARNRMDQVHAAENAQQNKELQQLMVNSDDGGAVLALSGGTMDGARQAAEQLRQQWLEAAMGPLREQLRLGTITQAEFTRDEARAQVNTRARADRAMANADTVPITRLNAQSALQMMAQNKARAVGAGNWDIVQQGINRLADGNGQQADDLRESFQFFSRGAGRFDIGGNSEVEDPTTGDRTVVGDARAGVRRASMYQIATAHPNTIRGASARYMETFSDPGASDAERLEASRWFNELESALPNATGEARDAIEGVLNASHQVVGPVAPGAAPTMQSDREVREIWMAGGTQVTGPGGTPVIRMQRGEVDHPTIPGARVQADVPRLDPGTGAPMIDTRTDRELAAQTGLRTYQREDPNSPNLNPPSDRRLKRNIVLLSTSNNSIKLYSFQYLWSDQVYVGVMAQDLVETHPEALSTDEYGYFRVDYSKLGLRMMTMEEYETTVVTAHA